MAGAIVKLVRNGVPKRAVEFPEGVGEGGAEIKFDEFDGFGEEIAEDAVELVGLANLIEGSAGDVGVARLLKYQAVAGEAVVDNVPEEGRSGRRIGDDQAA